MSRKYRIVHSIKEIEEVGKLYSYQWFYCFIPHDYKEHKYPAFIEWEEPCDGYEHGHWSWLPITMKKYAELRLAEIKKTREAIQAEIERDYRILSDLQDEEDEFSAEIYD